MSKHSQEELNRILALARKRHEKSFAGPLLEGQRLSKVDPGVRGPQWVSKATFAAPPEVEIRDALLYTIEDLGDGSQRYNVPDMVEVSVQWVGYRAGVANKEPKPADISKRDKFNALTAEAKSDTTIMYIHGGAYTVNGPATRRNTVSLLSKYTSARCYMVTYRLAPQSPFPSQILDVLVAYLTLLYPPPGSFHQPMPANRLVIAADSSGATLALSVVQVILSLQRRAAAAKAAALPVQVNFHKRAVILALPAGVAVQSPHFDCTSRSLPSAHTNLASDFLHERNPTISPSYLRDVVWPASPPRPHCYCESPTLAHPLVSPMMATRWAGAPPLHIAAGGGERLLDAARVVAQTQARQGVHIVWDEYERMPHNWPMILRGWPQTERCMRMWAEACMEFASSGRGRKTRGNARGSVFEFEPNRAGEERGTREMDVTALTGLTEDQLKVLVWKGIEQLEKDASEAMEIWEKDYNSKL